MLSRCIYKTTINPISFPACNERRIWCFKWYTNELWFFLITCFLDLFHEDIWKKVKMGCKKRILWLKSKQYTEDMVSVDDYDSILQPLYLIFIHVHSNNFTLSTIIFNRHDKNTVFCIICIRRALSSQPF